VAVGELEQHGALSRIANPPDPTASTLTGFSTVVSPRDPCFNGSAENLAVTGRAAMTRVTLSSKYHIVIPEDVHGERDLSPGQKLDIVALNGRRHVLPARDMSDIVGLHPGIDTSFSRGDDRIPSSSSIRAAGSRPSRAHGSPARGRGPDARPAPPRSPLRALHRDVELAPLTRLSLGRLS
jgi:hypothetical protein